MHGVDRDGAPTAKVREVFPDRDLADLEATCSLDIVSERGPLELLAIGELLNVTRSRVQQLEVAALRTLRARGGDLETFTLSTPDPAHLDARNLRSRGGSL